MRTCNGKYNIADIVRFATQEGILVKTGGRHPYLLQSPEVREICALAQSTQESYLIKFFKQTTPYTKQEIQQYMRNGGKTK